MTRQIATMIFNGEYKVVYTDSDKFNPYHVLHLYRDLDENGYPHFHKKTIAKYADVASCMFLLYSKTKRWW